MKNDQFEPWESNTYRTGSTTPPKAHSGLVAILLVLVIFLAGLVSILSVLNIRLFSEFYETQQQENIPLSLEIGEQQENNLLPEEAEPVAASDNKSIGIMGDEVTPVYQKHFKLPEGLFITHVVEHSTADEQGIREGDVLVSIGNSAVTDESSLKNFLEAQDLGEECTALIYRRDTDEWMYITLEIEQIEP